MSLGKESLEIEAIARDITSDILETVKRRISSVGEESDRTNQRMQRGAKDTALALNNVVTAGFSLFQQFDHLEKSQLRVDRAQFQVNKLLKDGKEDTEEYRLATERLRLAQNDITQQQQFLVLSILPTSITMLQGLKNAIGGVNLSLHATKIAIAATGIGALVIALGVVTNGFQDWTLVMKGLGFVLMGITFPLQAILRGIGFFVPEAKKAADEIFNFNKSLIEGTFKFPDFTAHAQVLADPTLPDLAKGAKDAAENFRSLAAEIDAASPSAENLLNRPPKTFVTIPKLGPTAGIDPFTAMVQGIERAGFNEQRKKILEELTQKEEKEKEKLTEKEREELGKQELFHDIFFKNVTSKSDEFSASLAETASKVTFSWQHGSEQWTKAVESFAARWRLSVDEAASIVERRIDEVNRKIAGGAGFPLAAGEGPGDLINRIQAQRIAEGLPTLTTGELIERGFLEAGGGFPGQSRGFKVGGQFGLETRAAGFAFLHPNEVVAPGSKVDQLIAEVRSLREALVLVARSPIGINTNLNVAVNSAGEIGAIVDAARRVGREQLNQSDLFRPLRLT